MTTCNTNGTPNRLSCTLFSLLTCSQAQTSINKLNWDREHGNHYTCQHQHVSILTLAFSSSLPTSCPSFLLPFLLQLICHANNQNSADGAAPHECSLLHYCWCFTCNGLSLRCILLIDFIVPLPLLFSLLRTSTTTKHVSAYWYHSLKVLFQLQFLKGHTYPMKANWSYSMFVQTRNTFPRIRVFILENSHCLRSVIQYPHLFPI